MEQGERKERPMVVASSKFSCLNSKQITSSAIRVTKINMVIQ